MNINLYMGDNYSIEKAINNVKDLKELQFYLHFNKEDKLVVSLLENNLQIGYVYDNKTKMWSKFGILSKNN